MTVNDTAGRGKDGAAEPALTNLRDIGETVSIDDQDIRGRMVKDTDGRDLGTISGSVR